MHLLYILHEKIFTKEERFYMQLYLYSIESESVKIIRCVYITIGEGGGRVCSMGYKRGGGGGYSIG